MGLGVTFYTTYREHILQDALPRREPDGGHSSPAPEAARPRSTMMMILLLFLQKQNVEFRV